MRAVLQRVSRAAVSVDDSVVASIGPGLMVLLGVTQGDGARDVEYIADKIVNLRIFSDEDDRKNVSLSDVSGEILVVSQFTLYADARNGRRPSYDRAAPGEIARPLYEKTVETIRARYAGGRVLTGVFGAHMGVEIVNDGPVTIILDSSKLF